MVDGDATAVAQFWAMIWAATVLSPGTHRIERGIMVKCGLVEPRGALRLTSRGQRILRLVQQGASDGQGH